MCNNELLLGYLYDELSPSERETFTEHLTSCTECRDEVVGVARHAHAPAVLGAA